jgi:hypothetical protein
MRLREFASDGSSSALDVLRVLKGLADKDGQPSTLPFPNVMKALSPFNLGISTPDGLIKWANDVDPEGNTLKISQDDSGNVILNTKEKDPEQPGQSVLATGPSVDQMAKSNSNLAPKI